MEDGNFRLSTRFLERHPLTSPPTNQRRITCPAALPTNFAHKNFFPETHQGVQVFWAQATHSPCMALAINISLLQTLMFWFIWPHCVSGTWTWVWQHFCTRHWGYHRNSHPFIQQILIDHSTVCPQSNSFIHSHIHLFIHQIYDTYPWLWARRPGCHNESCRDMPIYRQMLTKHLLCVEQNDSFIHSANIYWKSIPCQASTKCWGFSGEQTDKVPALKASCRVIPVVGDLGD